MNAAMKVILRQLANEGVFYTEKYNMHFLSVSRDECESCLASEDTLKDAVNIALKASISITALLSKLQDAIQEESEGTLGDFLVSDCESRFS